MFTHISKDKDIIEACKVAFFDKQVGKQKLQYLKIGIPNMLLMFLDWSCDAVTTLVSGHLGVLEQAS